MSKIIHSVAVPPQSDPLGFEDRIVLLRKAVANAAGGSAGAAVTVAVSNLQLPANYSVVVNPAQDATWWVTAKTRTGFTINLAPRLAANTLAAGTIDFLVIG